MIVCDDWMISGSMKEGAHTKVYVVWRNGLPPTSTVKKLLTTTYFIKYLCYNEPNVGLIYWRILD